MDFSKRSFPLRWNGSAGVVIPTGDGEALTLVYSTGLNLVPIRFVDFFLEFSGEMRLQEKGEYVVAPFYDPMLVTPGMRFHLTKNVDFALGLDVAVRTFKNLDFDYEEEMKGCNRKTIHFSGENGHEGSYCYAPTPLWAGAALLTIRFGGEEEEKADRPLRDTIVIKHEPQRDTIVIIMKDTTKHEPPKKTDFDNDGVPDDVDKCPNTKAGIEVGEDGCPPDHDKDGVPNYKDKCPNTEAGAEVDSNGCIPDFDKDGVPDNKDKCPNTLPGVVIDSVGCPVNKKEDLDELKKGIRFQTNSAKLTQRSFGTLNDVARLMKKFPGASLEVQGHTDNTGKDDYNMDLSQRRAQTVVDYLVKRGVESSRLRAVGYGNTMPIASNNSKEGRQINRRVEMVPISNE
ncbi:MAG: OmpA family protein [Fibrobacter sp.]|nr:OmpA family protein [Fibrobacter sp.]